MSADPRPAATYAEITNAVADMVARHAPAERARIAVLILRASALQIRALAGEQAAAEKLYQTADEFATNGGA